MVRLTIQMDDVNRFVTDPQHEAKAIGFVDVGSLRRRRAVDDGIFNLFVDLTTRPRKAMCYRLWFRDDKGDPFTLLGFKDVKDDPGFDSGQTRRRCTRGS